LGRLGEPCEVAFAFLSRIRLLAIVQNDRGPILNELSNAFLLVFVGLFPVVNPLGAAPLFLSLTSDCTPQQRTRLARLVAFNSFWLLVGSTLFGSLILEFFGLSIPVVRVAGGLLVTAMGWKLLNEGGSSSHEALHEAGDAGAANDSFYPLTLPLTVGPGAISVALTIGSHHPRDTLGTHAMLLAGAALLGLLAIALTIYGSYRFAVPLVRYLGEAGVNVLVRLSAFILVCIGIQIGWGGVSALVAGLQHPAALP
jgi:multiple antibiotic resistance protein